MYTEASSNKSVAESGQTSVGENPVNLPPAQMEVGQGAQQGVAATSADRASSPEAPTAQLRERSSLSFMTGILFMLLTFAVGLALGFNVGLWRAQDTLAAVTEVGGPQSAVDQASPASDTTGGAQLLNSNFGLFWEAMDLLYQDFYGEIPSSEQMTFGAIQGAVELLDDPNTSFLTPEEAGYFRSNIEGSFEGIGARIEWDEQADAVRISEPFENQPAWNAGLRRGDLIVAIDGESLVGSTLTEAIKKIRGERGSKVVLSVLYGDATIPADVSITRERIEIPTVSVKTLGDQQDIAYIRLSSFNENASRQVQQALVDALRQDPRGLIFDLRGNSGGLLREAVAVTSLFLEDGTVLIERFSDGSAKVYSTEGKAIAPQIPMLVLVNGESASASEIVAGALQDTERALLLGETTYGKGSVQLPYRLSNDGILRVTIAHWFTPNDRSIDGSGLAANIVVEPTEEQRIAGEDPQLVQAIEYLQKQ